MLNIRAAVGDQSARPRLCNSDMLRERIDAVLGQLGALDACPGEGRQLRSTGPLDGTTERVGRSAWESAVMVATLRDQRQKRGQSCSVRFLARELRCSHGRAGELLKAHDELSGTVALYVGWGDESEGHRILARLSYRDLRAVLAMPVANRLARARAIRQLETHDPSPARGGP